MSEFIWLHEDALTECHPAFSDTDCDSVFIWDQDYFTQMDYGFQRLVFIYEKLCQMKTHIYRGATVSTLIQLAADKNIQNIRVPFSPNPKRQAMIDELLAQGFNVKVIHEKPFVTLKKEPDLKRFFRFWNRARKKALSPNGG